VYDGVIEGVNEGDAPKDGVTEGVTEAEAPKDGVIDGVGVGLGNITGDGPGGTTIGVKERDGVIDGVVEGVIEGVGAM